MNFTSITQTSFIINWNRADHTSRGAVANYNIEVYQGTTRIHNIRDITSTASSYGISSGLVHNTNYRVKLFSRTSGGVTVYIEELYVLTMPLLPTAVGDITISNIEQNSVYASWGAVSNTTNYRAEVRLGSASGALVTGSPTNLSSTGYTQYYLSPSTTYWIKVYGTNASGNGGFTTRTFVTAATPVPAYVTTVTATPSKTVSGRVLMSWSYANNATGYICEIYRSSNGAYVGRIVSSSYTVVSGNFDGLLENVSYYAKVYGTNGTVNGLANDGNQFTTYDLTPPTVSIISSNGTGRIYFSYSATDGGGVGLRPISSYLLTIGSRDGAESTLGKPEYTDSTVKSFDSDVNGLAFVHNAYYWIGVRAYDKNANASSLATVRVRFILSRPVIWEWHTPKVYGNDLVITASEWNSFCIKVNQFRTYKSLPIYTFTDVMYNESITAATVNNVRNLIHGMSPPTAAPSIVSVGGTITASYFNNLRDSLNSIP